MLPSDRMLHLADQPVVTMEEYELSLLNAIAQRLIALESLTPSEITAQNMELHRQTLYLHTEYEEHVAKSASQALLEGFTANALIEVA